MQTQENDRNVPGADGQEVEWQFDALDVRPVGRWLERRAGSGGLSVGAAETRRLVDTYFDTDDWRLYRAGYALRVRRRGKSLEATMKSLDGGEDAVRWRREISEPLDGVDGDADDLAKALVEAPGAVGGRLRALVGKGGLRSLFEIRNHRRAYALSLDGEDAGAVGEVVLDETQIPLENGDAPAGFGRVEVEVESAAFDRMGPFVEELRAGNRLSPATTSKYEAGLFARNLQPPGPPDLGPAEIDASMAAGDVAFAVMRGQFAEFLEREPGTRLGEDPEELHDMRVASRRLRAAMHLFEEALPVRMRSMQEELKHFAAVLGDVRDLDVQLEQLDGWISAADPEDREPLGELAAVIGERREKARRAMLRALDSRRYERFVESFVVALKRGPSRRSKAAGRPVLAVAPDIVSGPYRKVRKAADRITKESPAEEYHELRKKGKRLRYALEFVAGVYGKPARELIGPLKELQDVLGDHQDADVAVIHLQEMVDAQGKRGGGRKLPPRTLFAMGEISHRYKVRAAELRGEFPKAYGRIRGKRWKNLKKVLEKKRPAELIQDQQET